MLECDVDTLMQMEKDGLILGRTEKETDVKILKKAITKQQKKNKKEKLNADQEK